MMTSAQVVETSVTTTDNSPSQDYTHPDDQTTQLNDRFNFVVVRVKCERWTECDQCFPSFRRKIGKFGVMIEFKFVNIVAMFFDEKI